MAVCVYPGLKFFQNSTAGMVVTHNQEHQGQFGMHPRIARPPTNANPPPQPNAQGDGRHRQQGGEPQQFSGHEQEPGVLCLGVFWHHGQIDKYSGQIKQAGKPAGHENDVKGFDPEHALSVAPSVNWAQVAWLDGA